MADGGKFIIITEQVKHADTFLSARSVTSRKVEG